ncbi:MAG: bifunctional 2-C-methyl-D-erythritol 4-phosphate cytidylyltransferase/2-C-methyl-D-erythritol 2,4-cyclodiphosphate synthase [Rhodospirillales bacterium]
MESTTGSRVAAIVVAGGRGSRAGGDVPKQYRTVGGVPMIRRSFAALADAGIGRLVAVIHPDDRPLFAAALEGGPNIATVVDGGSTRRESALNGLRALNDDPPEIVLIHDAARPFADSALVHRVIDALATNDGAIPALPVTDTLKRSDDGCTCRSTVSRDGLWRAQTPQAFLFPAILKAHENVDERQQTEWTDDAHIAESAGLSVAIVQGSEDNIKITSAGDFARAESLAAGSTETRIGSGFDVHRFGAGTFVTLCGVAIPHDHGLAGHSDADVGWHALTDALLGSIGAGDIGSHFPPSDPAYADASSDRFLRHAAALLREQGGRIVHVDVTLICERPKVGPRRRDMVERTAEVLGIEAGRVSIKATTTERLGFTGREEGIAAQAVATVTLPLR